MSSSDMYDFVKQRDGWEFVMNNRDIRGARGHVFSYGDLKKELPCTEDNYSKKRCFSKIADAEYTDVEDVKEDFQEFLNTYRTSVSNCDRCGGDHDNLVCHPLKDDHGTYIGKCPETGGPIWVKGPSQLNNVDIDLNPDQSSFREEVWFGVDADCPTCGHALDPGYLEEPALGETIELMLICSNCSDHYPIDIQLDMTVTVKE